MPAFVLTFLTSIQRKKVLALSFSYLTFFIFILIAFSSRSYAQAYPVPSMVSPGSGATIIQSSQNPCFSWTKVTDSRFKSYVVTVSLTTNFASQRWAYDVMSSSTTSVCWNGGSGWAPKGTTLLPLSEAMRAGVTYYWRILATYNDGSTVTGTNITGIPFLVSAPPLPTPTLISPANDAIVYSSSQNPCFSWSMSNNASFSYYTVTVSTTPDFPTTRWAYQINSISTTNVCWNNGSGWASKGASPPAAPGPLQNGVTYYWRVLATYTDGTLTGNTFAGRSFVHRNNSSSSAAISSSMSSSSSSRLSSVLSSSASSVTSLFNFNSQAPAAFNYPLTNANIPSLGTNQLVATTQGNLNVSNGAASYSIPIALPPAVRDLKPNLSLNYNSRSSNGLMGVGWNLGGLSAITRCRANFATEGVEAQKPNPRYTISDRLCLDGQKLVVASGASTANDSIYWSAGTEYKTELDNFAKIVAYGSSTNGGHAYFKVWTKDGRVLSYGEQASSQNSKVYATNQYGGVVSTWALDKVEDAYSNNYIITYEQNYANGEYYPSQIQLGATGLVSFTYQARAGQTPWGYDAGNKYQHTKVLDKVTTYVGTTTATPIKQYDVNYKISATTNRELVDKIYECGYESNAWKCARPLTFDWQLGELGFESTSLSANGTLYEDFNGDGYVDVIGTKSLLAWGNANGTFTTTGYAAAEFIQLVQTRQGKAAITGVRRTQGSTSYLDVYLNRMAPSTAMTSQLIMTLNANEFVRVADLNNDGLTDLNAGARFWIQQNNTSFVSSATSGGISALDSRAELTYIDINNDGLLDQTYVEALEWLGGKNFNNVLYARANSGGNFSGSGMIGRVSNAPFVEQKTGLSGGGAPNRIAYQANLGYWRTWVDINGDGNADLLYPDKFSLVNQWGILLSTGDQSYTSWPLIATRLSIVPMAYTSGQYSFVMDYNKDGLSDLILFFSSGPTERVTRVFYASYINGTLSFVNSGIDPFEGKMDYLIEMVVATSEEEVNPFRGDVNNDGLPDLIVKGQAYLAKQQQPDLINKITDGFGVVTELAYSPLTGHTNNGKPLYTPDTVVPVFPQLPVNRSMQVVKKISTSNGQGGLNHTYFNYSGGVQDVFRGFGGFKSIAITNTATNVNSTTEYRQDWPFTGRIKKQTLKDSSGKLISVTEHGYALHFPNSRFPFLQYTLQKNYELSTTNESSPISVSLSFNTLDACGNITEQNTKIGNGVSNLDVLGELSRQRIVNVYDYYGTPACNDDFLTRSTQEVAKAGNAGLKRVVTEFTPNSQGEVKTRTDFKGEAIQQIITYDRELNGVVYKITESAKDFDGTDEQNRITTLSNFMYGIYPQTITNAENHQSSITYDYRFGSVKTETAIGLTTTNTYDALGRLQTQQTPDGSLTENITFYCSSAPVTCPSGAYYGVATRLTHANQSGKLGEPLSITFYDALQREVRSVTYSLDGKVINQASEYSSNGYLARVSEPYATSGIYPDTSFATAWNSYSSYDALGRANSITGADGGNKTTSYTADVYGLKVTDNILVIKPVGGGETQTSTRVINPLGQVIKVEDALYNTVAYGYDAAGNLETTQVNNNIATKIDMMHDLAGNKIYIKDPDAGVVNFDYNGFGELRRQTWQKAITGIEKYITYDYDKLGRQTSRIDKPASGSNVTYSWVWDTRQQGQLSTRTGNGFSEDYYYDGFSRLSRQVVTTSGLSGGEFVYTYDNFSRPETVRYPNGFKIQRDYHAAGYQVQTRDITSSSKVLWALGNTLDTRGHFNNQLWGNGVVTQTGFDNKSGRLTSIKSGRLSGTNNFSNLYGDIQNLSYGYDTLGNLATRTTARTSATGVALENTTETYLYDKLNRIQTVTTSGVFGRTQTYQYDIGGLGNLFNRSDFITGSSVNNDVGTLAYDQVRNAGIHAVTSAGGVNYSYDKYGNMIARGSESIIYDTFNKPTRIAGASITDFYYGPAHELYKEISGTKTTYKIAGGVYEVIIDGSTTTQKSYVDGVIMNNRVLNGGTQSANDTIYLHTDHLGSVEATTNALGQFVNRMSFSAWGERQRSDWKPGSPAETFLTTNGYTGHDQLDNHSLVHMGGRVYDPSLGRFLSADLFVQSPYDTQNYNRYSYVGNNPLSYTDPSGYSKSRSFGPWVQDFNYAFQQATGCSPAADVCGGRNSSVLRGDDAYYFMQSYTNSNNLTAFYGGAFYDPNYFGQNPLFKEGIAQANADLNNAMSQADKKLADSLDSNIVFANAMRIGSHDGDVWATGYNNDEQIKTVSLAVASVIPVGGGAVWSGRLLTATNGVKGTEIVYRWMSKAELKATQSTGLLRGGRSGTHYVTNSANSNALRARQRLALPQTPEVRVTLAVPRGVFSNLSRVESAFKMPGGGMERTALGDIPVLIKRIQ